MTAFEQLSGEMDAAIAELGRQTELMTSMRATVREIVAGRDNMEKMAVLSRTVVVYRGLGLAYLRCAVLQELLLNAVLADAPDNGRRGTG